MSRMSPEQKLAEHLNKISSFRFYSKILRDLEPKNVPYEFISHIIVYLDDGEEILVEKDMLLNGTRMYYQSFNKQEYSDAGKITHTRTYVDIPALTKKVEEDLDSIYQGII